MKALEKVYLLISNAQSLPLELNIFLRYTTKQETSLLHLPVFTVLLCDRFTYMYFLPSLILIPSCYVTYMILPT